MSLIEEVRTQMRRANEGDEADRNSEPPHTTSDQNGEEAEQGMHGGGNKPAAPDERSPDRPDQAT